MNSGNRIVPAESASIAPGISPGNGFAMTVISNNFAVK
jgi:hypothetical protein